MEEVRLQKFLSDQGILSRRAAEREIANGTITVNGVPAHIGQKINPRRDVVMVGGQKVKVARGTHKTYVLLHKPRGYVTTLSDECGRPCVADLVTDIGERLYPVGRLDYNSEGMLLMTNDGDFTNLLTHPRHHVAKVYHVTVAGEVTKKVLQTLNEPMMIAGQALLPVPTAILKKAETTTKLQMVLHEGKNRQIRHMCEAVGLEVRRLRRVAIGPLKLGTLRAGNWRYLNREEVAALVAQAKEGKGEE